MFKMKNTNGYTMIEILVAIAVFVIVVIAGVAGFTNSNRMSELKNATDKLAEDIRDIQVKAQANVKEIDNDEAGGSYSSYDYEEGYKLKFTIGDPAVVGQIKFDELMSKVEILSQESQADDYIYYPLPDIALNDKHAIVKFQLWDDTLFYDPIISGNYNIIFLFPDAQALLIEDENNLIDELGLQSDRAGIKIYIKHDDLANWRGVVIVDRASGKISTEMINEIDPQGD